MQSLKCSVSLMERNPPNIPRVNCAFHPMEIITNFCICEDCLLPLCPSCIKIHTLEHVNLKKSNPSYEPITDLLEEIYEEVIELEQKYNTSYKNLIEIDARVSTFKTAIQQKIIMVKNDLISEIEKYFQHVLASTEESIINMNYVRQLNKYKEESKRIIIDLKNIEKCFAPENEKIMRTVIKYKGCKAKQQLQEYNEKMRKFLENVNSSFATFSVREDFKDALNEYLQGIKKVEIHDVLEIEKMIPVSHKLKQVYKKTSDLNNSQNKRQIRKSIGSFLQSESQVLNLSKEKIEDMSQNSPSLRRPDSQEKIRDRKSASKGKGLSLLQLNNCHNLYGRKNYGKAVHIKEPIEFNQTAFIRRPGF